MINEGVNLPKVEVDNSLHLKSFAAEIFATQMFAFRFVNVHCFIVYSVTLLLF